MSNITQKQLEANQENAKLGGVKTEEGKEIVKYNAVKHGLLSQQIVMEDESPEELFELEEKIREELNPTGEIQNFLVDRVVSGMWRLKRLLKIERNGMEYQKNRSGDMDKMFDFGKKEEKQQAREDIINKRRFYRKIFKI